MKKVKLSYRARDDNTRRGGGSTYAERDECEECGALAQRVIGSRPQVRSAQSDGNSKEGQHEKNVLFRFHKKDMSGGQISRENARLHRAAVVRHVVVRRCRPGEEIQCHSRPCDARYENVVRCLLEEVHKGDIMDANRDDAADDVSDKQGCEERRHIFFGPWKWARISRRTPPTTTTEPR